jgi:hypothetical protein
MADFGTHELVAAQPAGDGQRVNRPGKVDSQRLRKEYFDQRRMLVKADLVRRELVAVGRVGISEPYHQERNHQGRDNLLLFPVSAPQVRKPPRAICCRERLGGLLK